MRSPRRFRCAALAALAAGALFAVAGCDSAADRTTKGTTGTAEAEDVLLQPLAEPGPGPFTKSTARQAPSPSVTRSPQGGDGSATRTVHRVSGAVPGLYGGVRSEASCDVERQARLLTADQDKARAFAEKAGIDAVQVPGYLRSLTPVTLRADTQVTNHGYSAGSVTAFQAVLQAGTAVLVDSRGLPRVRCVCGNPLERPVIAKGQVTHRGERWAGYDPARILAIDPGVRPVGSLVIVDAADNTWIERTVGDDGGRDRAPEDPPPFEPSVDLLFPSPARPSDPAPTESAPPAPAEPEGTRCPESPGDPVELPPGCPPPMEPDPGTEAPDDFDGTPTDEPWEMGEGEPGVVPEPTQVSPGEVDELDESGEFGELDERDEPDEFGESADFGVPESLAG
ncbi:hypothetical protein AMK21_09565 [Streptomyces sp. CB00316]|uniref:DUF6777 domain-containing protein n=1 Tax=Streptomyces sp. CB00316 TaxID=1703932 RepID=UPI00093F8F80|nr:DUF6777 domain-containing protein [Streptomyces sp. CB00316]OKJ21675.1 hypothetical protein AMK21_09565 [Streptomyces sp. CB00316]